MVEEGIEVWVLIRSIQNQTIGEKVSTAKNTIMGFEEGLLGDLPMRSEEYAPEYSRTHLQVFRNLASPYKKARGGGQRSVKTFPLNQTTRTVLLVLSLLCCTVTMANNSQAAERELGRVRIAPQMEEGGGFLVRRSVGASVSNVVRPFPRFLVVLFVSLIVIFFLRGASSCLTTWGHQSTPLEKPSALQIILIEVSRLLHICYLVECSIVTRRATREPSPLGGSNG